MLMHGSQRKSRNDFRFVNKVALGATKTQAIAIASSAAFLSTGISFPLQARQAVLIKRFSALLSESGASSNHLRANGMGTIQIGPTLATPVAWYTNPPFGIVTAQFNTETFGIPLFQNFGDSITLENEWIEFDDYASALPAGLNTFQLNTLWNVANDDAVAAHTAQIQETLSAYIFEIDVMEGRDRAPLRGFAGHAPSKQPTVKQ